MTYHVKSYAAHSPASPMGLFEFDRRNPRPRRRRHRDPLTHIQDIDVAYERMLESDVKYRFVIDMASLKDEVAA
jgi:hypothetical protein